MKSTAIHEQHTGTDDAEPAADNSVTDDTVIYDIVTDDFATATPIRERRARPTLESGVHVQVLSSFSGRWVPGFAVAETGPAGYRLRRISDHTPLPAWFPPEEIRVVGS